MGTLIFRCSDGHLFSVSWLKKLFLSVHFGTSIWTRCPVDRRWRMARRILPGALSDAEREEAARHRL